MDHTPPELASALMQWINTFSLANPVHAWKDVADGAVLWEILQDIDPDFFQGELPDIDRKSNENWVPRWQNWKHIEKEVLQYIREQGDRLPHLGRRMDVDLKAIATTGAPQEMLKIVKCVLLAAMYSDRSNERMVEVMSSLGPKVAQPIAEFIGDMGALGETAEEYGETDPSSEIDYSSDAELPQAPVFQRDPELEREERLIQALQEKKRVELRLQDAMTELEELRQRTTTLEDELEESKYALDRRRGNATEDKDLAQLNQRADQDRQYIEELESDLANAKSTIDQQGRQLERLKSDAESKQELRDELQLVTTERDELRQKTKANENLRKKIQTLQEQERSTQMLRHELQSAQEQLQDYDALRERCNALEKASQENAQTIANGEQEIFDQKTAKRMLEYELKTITQKWEQSKDLLTNAQDTIREMEERLSDSSASRGEEKGMGSLDDELNAETGATGQEKEKSPKIKEPAVTADSIVLQQKLSIAASSIERLEKRCLDLLQENLGFKSIIDDASDSQKASHPFQHQAKRLEELVKELEYAKSKYIAASSQITDLQQRLDAARGKTVEEDEITLRANQDRQLYITDLEQTLRDSQNLLRHALFGPDALQNEEAALRATNEYKLILHQLEIVNKAPPTEAHKVIKSTTTSITDRIESVRGTLSAKTKMLADREAEFSKLRGQYEELKSQPPPVPPKDDQPLAEKDAMKQLQVLQRENKLIMSAWYDITTRLQSNTVHLARRADGGRSWLSRMRTSVNTPVGVHSGRRI